MKILYVEDNPQDADLARRWLKKRAPQFALDIVTTQSDAVARLSRRKVSQPYDLVLTDLRLPDGDGLSLLNYIRERTLPLAVVVITGTGDEGTAVSALKAGADDYLAKRNDYLERLPLTLESALQRHRAQAARQTRPLKVLYAEHHQTDVDLTRRHLQRYAPHIQFDVAPTGDEALARLPQAGKASPYDVLLFDYRLPGMNALEALKELREERGLDIPVVLITGQGDEELAAQALKLGAASYLVKHPGYLHQLPNELENAHYRAEIMREQEALRESEERFAKAFHSNPQPMSITTLEEGRYVDVNECWVEMSGYDREEIIDRTSIERNIWGSHEVRAEFVRQLQEQGAIRNLETRFRTKSGGIRVLLSSAELLELSGRHCILIASSDITERKQAEQALRESEERFRVAQQAARIGTWGWNILTGELHWSEGIYSLLGLEQGNGKLRVENFVELIHPADREQAISRIQSVVKKGEYYDDEFRIIRRDGSIAWLETKGRVVRDTTGWAEWMTGILLDITERKQATEALRESEARFRNMADHAPVMIWVTEADGTCIYVSQSWCEFTGQTPATALGFGWLAALHPADRELAEKAFRTANEKCKPFWVEYRVRRKDGEYRWVIDSATPRYDAQGEYLGYIGSVVDITERKQSEETLRQSEERFRRAFDHASIGMTLTAPEGRFLQINHSLCEMLGYSGPELLATNFQALTHPDDLETNLALVREALAGKRQTFQMEKRYIHKDGHTVQVSLSTSLLRDSNEQPLYFISQVQDITERKQTEEALRASEERFHSAFDHAAIGMALVAPDGRFLQVNRSLCQMLGYTRAELLATDFQSITHPNDLEADLASVRGVLAGELQTYQMEKRYFHKEGRVVWILLSVSLMRDSHGQPLYFISQIQDITERKQAEIELLMMQDALAAEVTAMTRLHEFSTRLLVSTDLQPVLEDLLDATIGLLNADLGNIRLHNPQTEALDIVAQRGFAPDFLVRFQSIPKGMGICGKSLQQRERIIIEDVQSDPSFMHLELANAAGYRSVQSTPLFSRSGKPLGVLSTHFREPQRPSDYELQYVDLYARQAAEMIELKQAEQALRESEQRLQEAQAIAHVGSFHWDVAANTVAWSDEVYRIYGLEHGQAKLSFDTYLEQVHPEHQEQVRRVVEHALSSRKPFEHEYRIIQPTGDTRWVFARCQPLCDADGNLIALQGICQDITERKWAEAELRRSNEELQASNEALQNTSEELVCKREEILAAHDQLKLVNDQLQTVNEVLEENLTELCQANSDLQNLITSTEIGTVFLDRKLCIKRYTPPIQKLFHILPSDINRPIEHLTPHFDSATLQAHAQRVLAESITIEREVRSPDGHWYIKRLLPYRTHEGKVDGVVVTFVEITERKLIEERMRRFFELPLVGMAITTPDRRFVVVNQKLCDMLGYAEEELTGMSWADVTHPEDIAENDRLLERTVRGEADGYLMDKRYIHRQGHIIYTSISARCVRRDDGAVDHLVLVVQDITERKQAEEAKHASQARFVGIVDIAEDAIISVDTNQRITLFNKGAEKIFGYAAQEIIGQPLDTLIPTRFSKPHRLHLSGFADSAEVSRRMGERREIFGRRKDGHEFPAEATISKLELLGEQIYTVMLRDITERKQAEQSLRASESRYRALFEKASDGIFLVTEQDDIMEVNQEACNLLGYSRAELLALKVTAVQAPEVRGRVGKAIARGLGKQREVRFETTALHRNGKHIPVEVTSTMVEEGERRLVLSIVRDITERKRIERQKQEQITSIVESEAQQNNFARIIGQSPALREMIRTAEKVAAADISPVLITGETGVGKGMIARAIHYTSYRAPFAFSHIDCASIPESLFESELFGHEQGAFTDARKARRGRLELAKGGTVFLDEISEIPLNLQAKLLQLLQEGTFHRIGGREEISLNARVIAATNRNLRAEVAAGRFRADLYQRLFVVQIDMPPLRARAGDALLLAEFFMAVYNKKYGKQIRQLAPQVVEALCRYSWPGNVRELEHAIERAVLFEESEQITLKHLRLEPETQVEPVHNEVAVVEQATKPAMPVQVIGANGTLDQMNENIIKQMVDDCSGNITQAARRLGISRSRIYRVLQGTNQIDALAEQENAEAENLSSFVN